MAFPRQSGFRRGSSRSPRRQVSWSLGPDGIHTKTAAAVTIFDIGSQAVVNGLTIVRIRGDFLATLTVAGVGEGFSRCAFGLCVITENVFNAGVGSVPSPIDDIGWDGWMVHGMFALLSSEAAVFGNGSSFYRSTIDGKAMRKWKASDILVGATQVADEVGTASITMALNTRVLAKLA